RAVLEVELRRLRERRGSDLDLGVAGEDTGSLEEHDTSRDGRVAHVLDADVEGDVARPRISRPEGAGSRVGRHREADAIVRAPHDAEDVVAERAAIVQMDGDRPDVLSGRGVIQDHAGSTPAANTPSSPDGTAIVQMDGHRPEPLSRQAGIHHHAGSTPAANTPSSPDGTAFPRPDLP